MEQDETPTQVFVMAYAITSTIPPHKGAGKTHPSFRNGVRHNFNYPAPQGGRWNPHPSFRNGMRHNSNYPAPQGGRQNPHPSFRNGVRHNSNYPAPQGGRWNGMISDFMIGFCLARYVIYPNIQDAFLSRARTRVQQEYNIFDDP